MKGFQRSRRTSGRQLQQTVISLLQQTRLVNTGISNTNSGGTLVPVAVGSPGFGSVLLQGFDKGLIQIEEALSSLQFICTNANLTQTFTGSYSIGTTAAVDTTLAGTASNIVGITTIPAATAGVSPLITNTPAALSLVVNNCDSVSGTGTKIVNGPLTTSNPNGETSVSIKTGPGLGLYLNLVLANVSTASVSVAAQGTISLSYSVTGNY